MKQSLIGVAFDICVHTRPGFLVDEVDDEPAQLRRVLDAVLRLAEDEAQQARLGAQALKQLHVEAFELRARLIAQRRPVVAVGQA